MPRLTPRASTFLDDVLKWAAGAPLRREHSLETRAKMSRAHILRRQSAARRAEWIAAKKAWRRRIAPPLGERMIDKICATWLQSGHAWHTSGDVVNLTGLDGRLARNTLAAMVRNGFAERRRIPGFKPARFTKEPRYLYRLTDRGRALGDLIRRLK